MRLSHELGNLQGLTGEIFTKLDVATLRGGNIKVKINNNMTELFTSTRELVWLLPRYSIWRPSKDKFNFKFS